MSILTEVLQEELDRLERGRALVLQDLQENMIRIRRALVPVDMDKKEA